VVDVVEAVEHGATAADADADADEHANEHDDDSLTVDGVLAVAPVHTGPDGPEMEPDGTRAMAEDEDEEPADFDDAPASLLFSLKDERGRSDNDRSDIPVESKPRKTLLGRRRP
jgi:hypothetical protein